MSETTTVVAADPVASAQTGEPVETAVTMNDAGQPVQAVKKARKPAGPAPVYGEIETGLPVPAAQPRRRTFDWSRMMPGQSVPVTNSTVSGVERSIKHYQKATGAASKFEVRDAGDGVVRAFRVA